jgi:hypothetical protein
MPSRSTRAAAPAAPATAASQSTALATQMPDDVRRDLLRAQGSQITTDQQLPRIKVMAAGAGLFEFGEGGDTLRAFEGVILNSHPRNVLWDKPYGESAVDENGNPEGPACQANDGKFGTPRAGFPHLGLLENKGHTHDTAPVEAAGTERIECATCPYNAWSSKGLVDVRGGKGKAVTNQKALYIVIDGQETPSELVIPPTSIKNFDAYLSSLLNRGDPVQSVVTKFSQKIEQKGTMKWAVVEFSDVRALDGAEFGSVMTKRQRYLRQIMPSLPVVEQATIVPNAPTAPTPGAEETEEIPF